MSQSNKQNIQLIGVPLMSELVKVGEKWKKKKAQCPIKSPDFRSKGTTKGVIGKKSIKKRRLMSIQNTKKKNSRCFQEEKLSSIKEWES